MHTEKESKGRGKVVKPGEQIAYNKAMHCNMQLFENESGEYYPVVDYMEQPTIVRGEYHPIGNRIHYPKIWGRKYAATLLLKHKLEDAKKQLENTQKELVKLNACLNEVNLWDDTL